jgi:hypothetical protein
MLKQCSQSWEQQQAAAQERSSGRSSRSSSGSMLQQQRQQQQQQWKQAAAAAVEAASLEAARSKQRFNPPIGIKKSHFLLMINELQVLIITFLN